MSRGSTEVASRSWCAEYRRISTSSELTEWVNEAQTLADAKRRLTSANGLDMLQRLAVQLQPLAERAPGVIRQDLLAVAQASEDPRRATGSDIARAPRSLIEAATRAMTWISENCNRDRPADNDEGEDQVPAGEWQLAQSGVVGDSQWTLHRTEASHEGVCVSFESRPPHTDGRAGRIQRTSESSTELSFPLESPPQSGGGKLYKGKEALCGRGADLFEKSDPVVILVQDEHVANSYNVLAGLVMPGTRSLEVRFEDGGSRTVNPVVDTFVLTYNSTQRVSKVIPDLSSSTNVVCDREPLRPEFFILLCHGG